jgi:hypothetical protein
MRSRRLLRLVAVVPSPLGRASLGLALISAVVAGCGGGSHVASIGVTHSAAPPTTSASAPYTAALEYARCMRQHGEPGFPDPNNPGGFSTGALAALNTSSHQFVDADTTCQRLLPNDGQPTPAEFQAVITQGLRFAHCMRAHGVSFPDPGISGDHMTIDLGVVDTNSPKYTPAARICETKPGQ